MRPKKILLAEDDADDRIFFSDFLKWRTDIYLLPAVENGDEVLAFLEEAKDSAELPDLIILDQNMPRRNGLETLRTLKDNSRYQDIPVIVYSTYADDNLKRKSKELGAALVLPKPATSQGYHQMVDAILSVVD